jgi:hypothetical protein
MNGMVFKLTKTQSFREEQQEYIEIIETEQVSVLILSMIS